MRKKILKNQQPYIMMVIIRYGETVFVEETARGGLCRAQTIRLSIVSSGSQYSEYKITEVRGVEQKRLRLPQNPRVYQICSTDRV